MKLYRVFLLLIFPIGLFAQKLEWAKPLSSNCAETGVSTACDKSGNIYVCGFFSGEMHAGQSVLKAINSGIDAFLMKSDPNGNYLWGVQVSGPLTQYAQSIVVDQEQNIYVFGSFNDSISISGTSQKLYSQGRLDLFLLKVNSSGSIIWVRQFGDEGEDIAQAMTLDKKGNVFITGFFQDSVDDSPDSTVIYKVDPSGVPQWRINTVGVYIGDPANNIAADDGGNVYLGGWFEGVFDFDPSYNVYLVDSKKGNNFVVKYDTNGSFVWVDQIRMAGAISLAMTNGEHFYVSVADHIIKYDTAGWHYWQRQVQSPNGVGITGLAVDRNNSVYSTGYYHGPADFDPGDETFILDNPLNPFAIDGFLLKLDSSGKFNWARQLHATWDDLTTSVSLDSFGNIYTTGLLSGIAELRSEKDSIQLFPKFEDGFILKFQAQDAAAVGKNDPVNFTAYPNPTSSLITIPISIMTGKLLVVVSNGFGREVMRFESAPHTSLKIDLDNLENGLYLISLFTDQGLLRSEKVLKF